MANSRGVNAVFIYNSLPRSSFGILVPEKASYQKPDDLKGNPIGVGTADGAEVGFARTILNEFGMSEPRDYTFISVGDGGTALAGLMRNEVVAYVGSTADRAILTYRGMPMRDITPDRFQTLFGNGYAVMGDFLKKYPAITLKVNGYTSNTGTYQHNQKLSDRRAGRVKQYLVNHFDINSSRLTTKGWSWTHPVTSNKTTKGRAQNRRVQAVATVPLKPTIVKVQEG